MQCNALAIIICKINFSPIAIKIIKRFKQLLHFTSIHCDLHANKLCIGRHHTSKIAVHNRATIVIKSENLPFLSRESNFWTTISRCKCKHGRNEILCLSKKWPKKLYVYVSMSQSEKFITHSFEQTSLMGMQLTMPMKAMLFCSHDISHVIIATNSDIMNRNFQAIFIPVARRVL